MSTEPNDRAVVEDTGELQRKRDFYYMAMMANCHVMTVDPLDRAINVTGTAQAVQIDTPASKLIG